MKGQGQKLAVCFVLSDMAIAASSWVMAYWLRFLSGFGPSAAHGVPPLEWCLRGLPLILLLTLVSCRVAGLYELNRLRPLTHELPGIVRASGILVLLWIAALFYRLDPYKSRLVIGLFLVLNGVGMVLARRGAWTIIHSLRGRCFNPSRALIVGSGRTAQKLAAALLRNGWTGLEPIGFVDDAPRGTMQNLPVFNALNKLSGLIEET